MKTVLNVGAGFRNNTGLHGIFDPAAWQEVRLDVNAETRPDIVGSLTDLSELPAEEFDAVWSSHSLEHLHTHQIPGALAEVRRILKPTGFAFITCPDLLSLIPAIRDGHLEDTLYVSPAGPIAPIDILFGHSASIARGNEYMSHRTAFTAKRLGKLLIEADFTEVWVSEGNAYDLWAVGFMPRADRLGLGAALSETRQAFLVPQLERQE